MQTAASEMNTLEGTTYVFNSRSSESCGKSREIISAEVDLDLFLNKFQLPFSEEYLKY